MAISLYRNWKLLLPTVILPWALYTVLLVVASQYGGRHEEIVVVNGVTLSLSTLVGFTAFRLFCWDPDLKTGLVYSNWALFFTSNSLPFVFFLFLEEPLLSWDPFARVYLSQYSGAIYFLLLPTSAIYAALSVVLRGMSAFRLCLITLVVVASLWVPQFAPYFGNARYLYTTPDVIDYKSIAVGLEKLGMSGNHTPSIAEIAQNTVLYGPDEGGRKNELVGEAKERRIMYLLPFLKGDNYVPLVYRPLHRTGVYMSLLSVVAIIFYLVYSYRYDPPIPAYYDKMMLLMLLYSICEAIHAYSYSDSISKEALFAIIEMGQLISSVLLILVFGIFYLRLQFITSVEGRYYEISIRRDQSLITRWRDSIDNWVLRQFIPESDLDRRFLIRGEQREEIEPVKRQ